MDPTIIYGSLVTVVTAAFGFLLRDREQWIKRCETLQQDAKELTASAVKLAASVPDLNQANLNMIIQLEQARKRITELEK